KKVIVSIVSEQTTPNFLFIKEMILPGSELLFITSKRFEERIDWIVGALGYTETVVVDRVVLPDGAEEKWDEMIGAIRQGLSKDKEYIVNLTCGTKFMISAVPNAFEGLAATFYYIPFPKNRILKIGDTWEKEIAYRMSVREYFDCNNTSIPGDKTPDIASDYTASFFRRFVEGGLDYEVINLLRAYRGIKEMPISVIEKEGRANSPEKYPPVPGLSSFLEDIDFPSQSAGQLSKAEAQYLTGGWYEEYIYTL